MPSFAQKHGLWTADDKAKAQAIIEQADAAGLEVLRVSFVDQHGLLRGKTLVIDSLKTTLENGVNMTSTLLLKDGLPCLARRYWLWQRGADGGLRCDHAARSLYLSHLALVTEKRLGAG